MRYYDLKLVESKKLFESKVDQINQNIEKIEKEIDVAAKTDSLLVNKVKSLVRQLTNHAHNVLNRVSQEQPVQEDASSDAELEALKAAVARLESVCEENPNVCPVIQPEIDLITQQINKIADAVEGAFEKGRSEGRAEAEKDALDFMNSIDEQLARLAQKIDGHVVKDWQAPDIKMTKADIKKEQTRQNTQNALMDLFDNLFRRKIKTGELKQQDALTFAKAAADGKVIDMTKLVQAPDGHGRIDDYVNPKYKKVYDIIIRDLLNSMPAGTGGNVGPGELALAALGNPTEKAIEKGDLIIAGEAYEIKGGNFSKGQTSTGGRLNSTKIADGKGAFNNIQKTLKKDFPDIWKALNELASEGELKGKTLVSGFTFDGVKNYEKALNRAKFRKPQAINFFEELIKNIVMNYKEVMDARTDETYHDLLDKAVVQNKDGIEINFDSIKKAITYVQYLSYNLADGVEKIMLLNKANRTFTIINDAGDFMSKIDSGHAIAVKNLSVTATDPQTASFHWTSK